MNAEGCTRWNVIKYNICFSTGFQACTSSQPARNQRLRDCFRAGGLTFTIRIGCCANYVGRFGTRTKYTRNSTPRSEEPHGGDDSETSCGEQRGRSTSPIRVIIVHVGCGQDHEFQATLCWRPEYLLSGPDLHCRVG